MITDNVKFIKKESHPGFIKFFKNHKKDWCKLAKSNVISRLIKFYKAIGDRNKVINKNFIMAIINCCLIQSLFEKELGNIFYKHNLINLCSELPDINNQEEAIELLKKIYDVNHPIRIIIDTIYTTDVYRSIRYFIEREKL